MADAIHRRFPGTTADAVAAAIEAAGLTQCGLARFVSRLQEPVGAEWPKAAMTWVPLEVASLPTGDPDGAEEDRLERAGPVLVWSAEDAVGRRPARADEYAVKPPELAQRGGPPRSFTAEATAAGRARRSRRGRPRRPVPARSRNRARASPR